MFQSGQSQFDVDASAGTSLSEILSAFSYALDLTEGQPAGHSLRACWVGTHIAQAIGLTGTALRDVYYATLLKDLGCSINAARVAEMFVGDDRQLKASFKLIGPAPADFGAFVMSEVGAGANAPVRDAAVDALLANAGVIMTDIMETRCTHGADIARKLRFSDDVAQTILHLDEHWDGSGLPTGCAGARIHIGARIALLAQVTDVFATAYGPAAALAEVRRRSGSWFDPALVEALVGIAGRPAFWDQLAAPNLADQLFALEPATLRVDVDEDYLDDIASAFGQVIDAKSPFTGGHSERVGCFTDAIAATLGLPADTRRRLRRAAILHDVGKLGVSSRVLEKPGKLDADEWAEMRGHAQHTLHILGQIGAMRDMAMIAAAHHERLDGKGYPFGLDARSIAIESRIITVADIFDALTADRPYRAAMPLDQAYAIMTKEVGSAIDADCFAALQAAVAAGVCDRPLPKLAAHFR
jgi:HD-GYP domain-containing protein (c-di-GMP phosphodiesterase class II)